MVLAEPNREAEKKATQEERKLETDLVDHHYTQKHTKHEEEQSVDVVLNGVADGDREGEENDGTNGEEPNSEEDVSNDLR